MDPVPKATRSRIRRKIRIALASFWLVVVAFLFYSMQARGVDPYVLTSNESVQVSDDGDTIDFIPQPDTALAGLLLYPGALVDPEAYAPMAREIAEAGYRAVVVRVPFRIALLDRQWQSVVARTTAVISLDSRGRSWVLGGHSRGGRMAAQFAGHFPELLDGLLLIGTSHPRKDDLSGLNIDVLKVFGAKDGLASVEEVNDFAGNLPDSTKWVRVEGGNHSQFGSYGWQLGDGRATIDRETQQRITVSAVVEQLERVTGRSRATL